MVSNCGSGSGESLTILKETDQIKRIPIHFCSYIDMIYNKSFTVKKHKKKLWLKLHAAVENIFHLSNGGGGGILN